jgi:hypothetical protein
MNRFSVSYDGGEAWLLDGEPVGRTRSFGTLPEALDCARKLVDSEESLIELRVSGFYACVHQELGWPRRIHSPLRAA